MGNVTREGGGGGSEEIIWRELMIKGGTRGVTTSPNQSDADISTMHWRKCEKSVVSKSSQTAIIQIIETNGHGSVGGVWRF